MTKVINVAKLENEINALRGEVFDLDTAFGSAENDFRELQKQVDTGKLLPVLNAIAVIALALGFAGLVWWVV